MIAHLVEHGHGRAPLDRRLAHRARRGRRRQGRSALIEMMDGVHEVLRITEPYKLASRTFKPEDTGHHVGDVRIGGDEVIVMAGPCSAETEAQVQRDRGRGEARRRQGPARRRLQAAQLVPYSFQGLGEEGLRMLREAATRTT